MKIKLLISLLFFTLALSFLPFFASPLVVKILESRLKGEIQYKKATLSWWGPQRFENVSFRKEKIIATIDLFESEVPFWKIFSLDKSFILENGTIAFSKNDDHKITKIQASVLKNRLLATGTTPQGGMLKVQGKVLSKRNFDLAINLEDIPTILPFEGIFKPKSTFNLNGSLSFVQNQGILKLAFDSPNATCFLHGAIKNNILTLKEPLAATCQLSSDSLSKIIPPKLLTNAYSENPFSLTLFPENFSCRLSPFSLEGIHIEKGILDLGKIYGKGGDFLNIVLQLLKNQPREKTIELWLSPFAFSVQEGLIQWKREDALLAKSIHLCTWGEMNVAKNKLQMILGIPADTLEQTLGIQNLARNYVLQIPIQGSFESPEVDTTLAIAKIAALKTTGKIPTKGGKIFGKLVNAFTEQKEEETPAPQRPFPWEK